VVFNASVAQLFCIDVVSFITFVICSLCPALKAVFEHGLKKSSLLGGPGHPWLFIEEVTYIYSFSVTN